MKPGDVVSAKINDGTITITYGILFACIDENRMLIIQPNRSWVIAEKVNCAKSHINLDRLKKDLGFDL